MSFFYTRYYYPLQRPLLLSKQLGFYLDNPRTKGEVKEVTGFLEGLCDSYSYFRMIAKSKKDIGAIERYLFRFRDNFIRLDDYVEKLFASYQSEKVIEFIARMIVIARYDDAGAKDELRKQRRRMKKAGKLGFTLLSDEHPALVNSDRLKNFSHLLSILSYPEIKNYWGHSFLIDHGRSEAMDDDPWFNFMMLGGMAPHFADEKLNMHGEGWCWEFFPTIKDSLICIAEKLDEASAQGHLDKLLYIGNILKIASRESPDAKVKVLLLTSILELLLTHNPDFNRFNVEDSINKQFQLKTSVLLYLNDQSTDVDEAKKRLKIIYQARSSIAHGNFGELAKIAGKKKDEPNPIEDYAQYLYLCIRAVLEEYLKNRKFIEFLKGS